MDTQRDEDICPEFHMGDRLRKARENKGLNRMQFSEIALVDRKSVANYEDGRRTPPELVLERWAMQTGVSLHWLKTGQRPPGDGPLAQLAELRTFNPKSARSLTRRMWPRRYPLTRTG